jgi:hypothetical protein
MAVDVRHESRPGGPKLRVNGTMFAAPRTFASWEGYKSSVYAPSSQVLVGTIYVPDSWSNGAGLRRHRGRRGQARRCGQRLSRLQGRCERQRLPGQRVRTGPVRDGRHGGFDHQLSPSLQEFVYDRTL